MLHFNISCKIIKKSRDREKETGKYRERESAKKANRKAVWFNFHIGYRGENIAKGLQSFRRN